MLTGYRGATIVSLLGLLECPCSIPLPPLMRPAERCKRHGSMKSSAPVYWRHFTDMEPHPCASTP